MDNTKRIEAETEYRLAKWIIMNLEHDGLVTGEEARLAILKLLEHYHPITECLEVPEYESETVQD